MKHSALTGEIISAFYKVYNTLGFGFLEKVYESALLLELRKRGLRAENRQALIVFYEGTPVGKYYADIIVEDKVVIELKTAENIDEAHLAQLTNYLRATDCEVGLVLNFGPKPQHRRRIFDNPLKGRSPERSV